VNSFRANQTILLKNEHAVERAVVDLNGLLGPDERHRGLAGRAREQRFKLSHWAVACRRRPSENKQACVIRLSFRAVLYQDRYEINEAWALKTDIVRPAWQPRKPRR
jgi:hypothetical protein